VERTRTARGQRYTRRVIRVMSVVSVTNHREHCMKTWIRGLFVTLLFAAVPLAQQAAQRPAARPAPAPAASSAAATATPESVGLSSERLERMHRGMQGYVDRHEAGGIVTLTAREGKVVDVNAVGYQDVENSIPMRTDTIFRIASMSKPITAVAVLMLYEEGKLLLNDPVSKYIPAFRTMKVAAQDGSTVAATRQITIRDLLTHRSGITY
jgi:CubicO group peptidase (beta-lactamase class C family)